MNDNETVNCEVCDHQFDMPSDQAEKLRDYGMGIYCSGDCFEQDRCS